VQRIRTRLGLHPELFKHGDIAQNSATDNKTGITSKINGQQSVAVRNCADLNKKEFTDLAKQGLLPDGYSQLAEQCRIQQNANYERMSRHIADYSRPGYLQQISERARPYLYHIANELSKHGLPMDLALLPIVESAYQPTALSNKAAAGIWQFIPSTGQEYGLEQNEDYDARLDITASTHAAIRFLSGLNGHFKGDWLLSLAAYNCGQGAVDAAIARNQVEGLTTDFWSLDLPAETKDYVPRLLALSAIFASPSGYGLKLRSVKNEPYFIKVNIEHKTDIKHLTNKDLRTVAKLADFDPEQFGLLNTAYLNSTLPENKPFTLLMPISNANLLHQSLAFMAQSYKKEKNIEPTLLSELALSTEPTGSKFQVPLLSLSLNQDQQWALSKGQRREFNVKPKSTEEIVTAKATDDGYWAVHYLDKGETLQDVAESHGISEEFLRVANKFKSRQSITLGQRLLVPIKQMVIASMKKTRTSVLFRGI
jgi:soluble lytic murein transglycosylase-like protein